MVKYRIAIGYYVFVPGIGFAFIVLMASDVHPLIRLWLCTAVFCFAVMLFNLFKQISDVANCANSPYLTLNSIFCDRDCNHSIHDKLQLLLVIERLAQQPIAFTVYDFFPMNTFEWQLLVINCFKFFFLIFNLIGHRIV